jgi:hypothetical protein
MLFALFLALLPSAWLLLIVLLAYLANEPMSLKRQAWGAGMTAERRYGPILLALAFGLVTLPVVAASLHLFNPAQPLWSDSEFLPLDDDRRWSTAMSGVLVAAAVAGAIGSAAVRMHAKAGAVFTFLIALIVGIAALPILPAILGERVGAVLFCLDGCNAIITSNEPATGLRAVLAFGWAPLFEPVVVGVLAIGVAIWSWVVRTFFMPDMDADSPTQEGDPGRSSAGSA